jgi:putative RecB family exonuclease
VVHGTFKLTAMTHRSYSQKSEFLDCGWKYKLHRIDQVPELPAVWFPGGSAVHATLEVCEREQLTEPAARDYFANDFAHRLYELDQIEPDRSKWMVAGRASKAWPLKETVAWWEVNGLQMVSDYLRWREGLRQGGWKTASVEGVPAIEMETTGMIGTVEVKAFVDVVLEDPSGVLVPVDYKTGTREPGPEQLGLYSVLLERLFKRPVTWGTYYMARKGTTTQLFDLSRFTEENLARQFETLDRAIEAEIFIPHVTPMCATCSVNRYCEFYIK